MWEIKLKTTVRNTFTHSRSLRLPLLAPVLATVTIEMEELNETVHECEPWVFPAVIRLKPSKGFATTESLHRRWADRVSAV